jgi:hypothetical protein
MALQGCNNCNYDKKHMSVISKSCSRVELKQGQITRACACPEGLISGAE